MKYAIIVNGEEQPLKFFANNINELFEFLLDYDIDFDTIALMPLDEYLPVYNREAEIFQGTLQDIDKWLRGVEWSRNYDNLMMSKNDEKRQTAENKYQQRELLRVIRDGEKSEKLRA